MDRTITITDFLTDKQILYCATLFKKCEPGEFAKTVKTLIIEPNISEINQKLGQENDPMFLAYAIEYVFSQASK